MITILGVLVFVVFLALGITFIIKAVLMPPRENIKKISAELLKEQHELKASHENETKLKAQLAELKRDLETAQNNIHTTMAQEEAALKKLQEIQTKENEYREQISTLENQLAETRREAQTEIKNALELINTLRTENQALKEETQSFQTKIVELKDDINARQTQSAAQQLQVNEQINILRQENDNLIKRQEELQKLEGIKEELHIARQTLQDSLTKNKILVDALNADKQNLQEQIEKLKQNLLIAQNEKQELAFKITTSVNQLTKENRAFAADKAKDAALIEDLQKQVAAFKSQNIDELTTLVQSLKSENALLLAKIDNQLQEIREKESQIEAWQRQKESHEAAVAERSLEELKTQNRFLQEELREKIERVNALENQLAGFEKDDENRVGEWRQAVNRLTEEKNAADTSRIDLERNIVKVKEFNKTLLEKEQMLHYELTKSRAQAMGFEQISQDFKTEIERYNKDISQLRLENKQFKEQLTVDAAKIAALQQANTELSRQNRIAEFELAKSREQLSTVEKAYADFQQKLKKFGPMDEKNDVEDV